MAQVVRSRGIVLLALFVSGLAGLMHEVIWAKLLVALIGNTADSNAVVLCVFMAGLAIGAIAFGWRADRWQKPLLVYAWLEALIGLYGLLLPVLIGAAGAGYESLAGQFFERTTLLLLFRIALAVVIIFPPAIMMGATLPVLARYLIDDVAKTRREVASLYSVNNFGAVVGSGLAGLWALGTLGISKSLWLASGANLVAGLLVWWIHTRASRSGSEAVARAETEPALASTSSYTPTQYTATLIALFLSGFAAMGYEVTFIRVIALSFGSSTYSFTVMLMCFIAGIGLGSAVISMIRVRRPLLWLGLSQLLVVVSFVLSTYFVERLPYYIGLMRVGLVDNPQGFPLYELSKALLSMLVLLVPTMCIGISFPLVTQVQARSVQSIAGTVGSTYAWNTAGNVLGVLVTGQLLINWGGIKLCFDVNLIMSLLAGLAILAVAVEWPLQRRLASAGAAVVALLVYFAALGGWTRSINYAFNHLRMREPGHMSGDPALDEAHPTYSFDAWRRTYVMTENDPGEIRLEEDENATVMGVRFETLASLFINTKPEASCAVSGSDMNTQLMIAHLPMLFNPKAKDMLMIGYGSGVTLGTAVLHPTIQRADLAEISQAVLNSHPVFQKYNYDVLNNKVVHAYQEDARTFLRTVPRTYDVIISEPSNPWIAGVSGLFTREFFQECSAKLNPGGILCMWFHQYEMSDENVQLVLRTLHDVFGENIYAFLPDLADVICLASNDPIQPDFAAMEDRLDHPAIRNDLAKLRVFTLAQLLAYHFISPGRIHDFIGQGPINTDDHQRLEYEAPKDLFHAVNSTYLHRIDGYNALADGTNDSLLERYYAYRETTGEPLSRSELEFAADQIEMLHSLDGERRSKLPDYARYLAGKLSAEESWGYRPARGGIPETSKMEFIEANNLGVMMILLDRSADAVPLLLRALELQPENSGAVVNCAAAMAKSGEFERAVDLLTKHLEAKPEDKAARIQLVRTYLGMQEIDRARTMLEEMLSDPADADAVALSLLGDVMAHQGEKMVALQLYEQAINANPLLWDTGAKFIRLLIEDPINYPRALEDIDTLLHFNHANPVLLDLKRELEGLIQGQASSPTPSSPDPAAHAHETHGPDAAVKGK
jgi:predicted membrane-bound spermidine synthase/tetratricopeptide (TPR) repeat protein